MVNILKVIEETVDAVSAVAQETLLLSLPVNQQDELTHEALVLTRRRLLQFEGNVLPLHLLIRFIQTKADAMILVRFRETSIEYLRHFVIRKDPLILLGRRCIAPLSAKAQKTATLLIATAAFAEEAIRPVREVRPQIGEQRVGAPPQRCNQCDGSRNPVECTSQTTAERTATR